MEPDAGSRDVDDGVDGAHLVEMYLVDRGPVHASLGLAEPGEDARGLCLDGGVQGARRDQGEDRLEVATGMLMSSVRLVMGMAVLPRPVIVIVHVHVHLGRA